MLPSAITKLTGCMLQQYAALHAGGTNHTTCSRATTSTLSSSYTSRHPPHCATLFMQPCKRSACGCCGCWRSHWACHRSTLTPCLTGPCSSCGLCTTVRRCERGLRLRARVRVRRGGGVGEFAMLRFCVSTHPLWHFHPVIRCCNLNCRSEPHAACRLSSSHNCGACPPPPPPCTWASGHTCQCTPAPMLMTRWHAQTPQVSDPGAGVFGAGAHSDYGMLTLLATDSVPGLQVGGEPDGSGGWVVLWLKLLANWLWGTGLQACAGIASGRMEQSFGNPLQLGDVLEPLRAAPNLLTSCAHAAHSAHDTGQEHPCRVVYFINKLCAIGTCRCTWQAAGRMWSPCPAASSSTSATCSNGDYWCFTIRSALALPPRLPFGPAMRCPAHTKHRPLPLPTPFPCLPPSLACPILLPTPCPCLPLPQVDQRPLQVHTTPRGQHTRPRALLHALLLRAPL